MKECAIKNPEWLKHEIGQLFTPATPINEKDLFAGRGKQIEDVVKTVNQRGRHAIIYGERGVGKTSLANVLSSFFGAAAKAVLAPREECHTADTYHTLWGRILGRIKTSESLGFSGKKEGNITLADLYAHMPLTPDVIREALGKASENYLLIIIVDELDRLSDPRDNQLFADTIKTLSDYAVKATLVLVGVADAVDELIAGHESIQRNLQQIPMPRMSPKELRQIVNDRLPKVGMTIRGEALNKICALSRGLPHYTHLISQFSAWAAVDGDSLEITIDHVNSAVKEAISHSQQTVQSAYHKATVSPRKDNLFAEVLLACALAPCDEFGFFTAADVRQPMSKITGEDFGISRFIGHLGKFTTDTRGEILQEIGERYQRRFRFRDPLIQPYIVMRGVGSGLITLDQLQDYPESR